MLICIVAIAASCANAEAPPVPQNAAIRLLGWASDTSWLLGALATLERGDILTLDCTRSGAFTVSRSHVLYARIGGQNLCRVLVSANAASTSTGRQLAFLDRQNDGAVTVLDVKSDRSRVVAAGCGVIHTAPAWTEDQDSLLFLTACGSPNGPAKLAQVSVRAGAAGDVRLADALQPTGSALALSGRLIAFELQAPGSARGIAIADRSSGIVLSQIQDGRDPALSRDAQWLAFLRSSESDECALVMQPTRTTDPAPIARQVRLGAPCFSGNSIIPPLVWSNDGRRVALVFGRRVLVIDRASGQIETVFSSSRIGNLR